MNKKLITLLIVLAVICSISIVAADNNTTQSNDTVDLSQYITADQINSDKVEFSDGFTGFLIDSSKNHVTKDDGFTSHPTSDIELGDYLKLAIVECYRQNCENKIGEIIASFADGSYKDSGDSVIKEVLSSSEKIGDNAVVEINNNSEATFNFEVLKPIDDETSDYIAYTVSFKTIEKEDSTNDTSNKTDDVSKNKTDTQKKEETAKNTTAVKKQTETTKNTTDSKDSAKTAPKQNNTEVHEQNKTIVNKTNTVIVNQNNTTVINQTNVKHINNTTNDTPPQKEDNNILMKVAGNPITLLIIVIIVIAIVAVAYNRRE